MSTTTNSAPSSACQRSPGSSLLLSNRERFLKACRCEAVDRPPVWLMRQAGRALPEYRALKEKYTFLELVQNPELAAEVTLQPIRRFNFDAAILFSDILVICEGLGQKYQFRDKGGIEMEFILQNGKDIDRLDTAGVNERLKYVAEALRLIRRELANRTALIGFSGSPWTLANFMVEGGGVKEYSKAKALFHTDPALYNRLMGKLTTAITGYLRMQIEAGAEVVQIFDSLAGGLSDGQWEAASGCWIREIIYGLGQKVPVIVFAKGAHGNWAELQGIGAQILGVDWNARLSEVRRRLPSHVGVQGNLDPFLLTTTPEATAADAKRILQEMKGLNGHIFNLGHGVPPGAKLECIASLVNTVQEFR